MAPEAGELHLLKFLDRELDDSYEVFFNPFLNGDRPDIVVMKQGQGVLIIEVKDYNLDKYELDDRKNFVVKGNRAQTRKSPVSQVLKYKSNLFELHIPKLLEKKIKNFQNFNTVRCAVYFHLASHNQVSKLLVNPFKEDEKYQTFLKHQIRFLGRDSLNAKEFDELLRWSFLRSARPSSLFTDDIYLSIRRYLQPPRHTKDQGVDVPYSRKQLSIIYESERKEQRIKGVAGSGKTTVLAGRAVQAHKRLGGEVLILTYNVTLRNFIKDKISKVKEDFDWKNFIILNYHDFINQQLNNLEIPVVVPDDFDNYTEDERTNYFESNYYSNKGLFQDNCARIKHRYNVILIDEIQDYKRLWMEIVKDFFLAPGGEYVLFGDVKQNIYSNEISGKDVVTNVRGVTTLNNCFRSEFRIRDLAINYQRDFFQDKYEIDGFNKKSIGIDFGRSDLGFVNYLFLPNADHVNGLYTIIHENSVARNLQPNDITVLGQSIEVLRKFDAYYRHCSNERTNTMFETNEMVYLMGLNLLSRKSIPSWLDDALKLIGRQTDTKSMDFKRGLNQLSTLLTVNDLFEEYPDRFRSKLKFYCKKFGITLEDFRAFVINNDEALFSFASDFGHRRLRKDIKSLRDYKKRHFYMNSGTIKISTIHSFKGWESENIFLILEEGNFQAAFEEILYTGITRTRANLVLINFGNLTYHDRLKELIASVN